MAAPTTTYYLRHKERTLGPATREQIEQLWREARINAKTLYWDEPSQEWKAVAELLLPKRPPAPNQSIGSTAPKPRPPYRLILRRTWLVFWLCLFGFLHTFVLFGLAIRLKPAKVPMDEIYFQLALVPGLFVAWLLVWRMSKWGVYLLVLYWGMALNLAYHHGQVIKWVEFALYTGILLLLLTCYRRMRWR